MLFDSHCHLHLLNLDNYQGKLALLLDAATRAGVSHMLCVSIDLKRLPNILAICKKYPNIFASVGLHPNESIDIEPTVDELLELARDSKIVAIGETGLDYYRTEQQNIKRQQQRFCTHIQVARLANKPLIIHSRQAQKDTLAILKAEKAYEVGGVMHCFTEDWDMAKKAMDLNFYISFSGIITFKNADSLREVVKKVPMDSLLIETDAPFLAPVPYRGKQNEPSYVRYVAGEIASIKAIDYEKVAEHTMQNCLRLFNIS